MGHSKRATSMVSTGKNQYTLPLKRYGQRGDRTGQILGEMTAERNAAKARAKAMKNTANGKQPYAPDGRVDYIPFGQQPKIRSKSKYTLAAEATEASGHILPECECGNCS